MPFKATATSAPSPINWPITVFGIKVVAVSDEFGGIIQRQWLSSDEVNEHLHQTGKVIDCPGTEPISNADLLELEVDILIPAAIENQLTSQNAEQHQSQNCG